MLDASFLDRIRAAGSGAATTFEIKSPIVGPVVLRRADVWPFSPSEIAINPRFGMAFCLTG